jgi:bifunctional non-homologous end joining protein LigD
MEEKFDGRRVLVRKRGNQIAGINRTGLTVDLPTSIVEAVKRVEAGDCLLDGEAVGDVYHAFDLLQQDGMDLRPSPYAVRYATMIALVDTVPLDSLRFAEASTGTGQKRTMLDKLKREKKEGVVFKDRSARYTPGRPASGGPQLKLKFYATASCLVAGTNGSKRSVKLELMSDNVKVAVGSVTVPANQAIPPAGSIAEVRYLYAYEGGSLYQPVLLGVRDDIKIDACTVGQLKFKSAEAGEDDITTAQ